MNINEDVKLIIKKIILEGTQQERLALFTFNNKMPVEKILFKFNLFINAYFIRYLKNKSAPFHDEMIRNLIKSYRGENYINLAFRGSAKSSYAKLFLVFVLLNDEDRFRKYIKIISRDLKNPKQIVTDVYNMCLELKWLYGDVFEKEGDKKREETMGSFTMKSGVKLTAGTVGQAQRGHLQDAFRPDWILFDDCEDRESISSAVITQGIIDGCDEAITGLAPITGNWCLLGNYISEDGVVQWFINKSSRILQITPLINKEGKPNWDIFTQDKIIQLKKDTMDFDGEYNCDPTKSHGKFFDLDRINNDLKTIARRANFTSQGVSYWGSVVNHHRYGIGADTSEGVGRDSSALVCFNLTTGELIATYHNNEIKPELFAYTIAKVGKDFNNCVIAPEMNSMSGGIVVQALKTLPYENIYRHVDSSQVIEKESSKYGWHTNSKTKPQMFMDFRRDYNDGLIKIYDENVLKEMKSYNNVDLTDDGGNRNITRHFDLLIATVIAWQMKKYVMDFNTQKRAVVTYHDI